MRCEGTTISLAFVKDMLFPYSRRQLGHHVHELEVARLFDDVRAIEGKPELEIESVIECLVAWIDADRKLTPLEALQGRIGAEGYSRKWFVGHVYDDAAAALRAWNARGPEHYVKFVGLDRSTAVALRTLDARRPDRAPFRVLRHHERAQVGSEVLPAHCRGDWICCLRYRIPFGLRPGARRGRCFRYENTSAQSQRRGTRWRLASGKAASRPSIPLSRQSSPEHSPQVRPRFVRQEAIHLAASGCVVPQ